MGEIVNLRTVRKRRERRAKKAEAAHNRAAHGRSAEQKALDTARGERDGLRHEGHRLDPTD